MKRVGFLINFNIFKWFGGTYLIKNLVHCIMKFSNNEIKPILIVKKKLSKSEQKEFKNLELLKTDFFHNQTLFDRVFNKFLILIFGKSKTYDDFFLRNNESYYEEFFSEIYLTQSEKNLFIRNAQRFQEICLDNFTGLKNPLWQVYQTGEWPIYFHIESWDGPVTATAINRMRSDYQRIANEWIAGLRIYDPTFVRQVDVKLFGFVFNTGVLGDKTFTDVFSKYPQVRDYTGTNESSPWKVVFRDNGAQFNQNWYSLDDFSRVKVVGIGEDLSADGSYYPNDWEAYQHPENIDYFLTKFWHKVSWDAVAQRQYLKLGGNVTEYELGETRYSVFVHEMGHTFFLDDIYSIDKYPDGTEISSIMNNSGSITDFDTFTMRIVWKQQKEMYQVSVDP